MPVNCIARHCSPHSLFQLQIKRRQVENSIRQSIQLLLAHGKVALLGEVLAPLRRIRLLIAQAPRALGMCVVAQEGKQQPARRAAHLVVCSDHGNQELSEAW
eukprot:3246387-Prymnesium_polylepis.1